MAPARRAGLAWRHGGLESRKTEKQESRNFIFKTLDHLLLSALSSQLSALSSQLSALSSQLSALSSQLSASLLSGNHSVEFDASQLASGVYLYRLEAKGCVQTRKMILMK
jgi:hypothetical protein